MQHKPVCHGSSGSPSLSHYVEPSLLLAQSVLLGKQSTSFLTHAQTLCAAINKRSSRCPQLQDCSERELLGILDDALEGDEELGGLRAVHDAVVAGQVDLHLLLHANAAVGIGGHCGLAASHGQNGCRACTENKDFLLLLDLITREGALNSDILLVLHSSNLGFDAADRAPQHSGGIAARY